MRRSTMIVVLITFALLLSVPGLAAEKENLALRATVTVDSTFTAYPEGTQLNDGELNDHDPRSAQLGARGLGIRRGSW